MNQYTTIADRFGDDSEYFGSVNALMSLKSVQNFLENAYPQMLFLLGEAGSGKSYMIKHIKKLYEKDRLCLVLTTPVQTQEELLEFLIAGAGEVPKSRDLNNLKEQIVEIYGELEHIILVDMAVDFKLLENIRILNELKILSFLITLDTKVAEDILLTPHFYSCAHQVIYMHALHKDEFNEFVAKFLDPFGIKLTKETQKLCWDYTQGNFGNIRAFFRELFLVLEYGSKSTKNTLKSINPITLKMAAMKSSLLPCSSLEYEMVYKEAKKDPRRTKILLTFGLISFLGILIGYVIKDLQDKPDVQFIALQDVSKNLHVKDEPIQHIVEPKEISPKEEIVVPIEIIKDESEKVEEATQEVEEVVIITEVTQDIVLSFGQITNPTLEHPTSEQPTIKFNSYNK